jgi:Xaa-Pro aminopeptidase
MKRNAAVPDSPDDRKAETAAPAQAAHDTGTPQALVDFMLESWEEPSAEPPPPIEHHQAFARRRQAISQRFPKDVLVVPTGHEKVRSNDTHYRFRPSSDFYYLTGNLEPDCVLVMVPRLGGHDAVLFVEPGTRSDATFFTDRARGELWAGPRLGVPRSRHRYAVDDCRALGELAGFLSSLADRGPSRVVRGFDPLVDGALAESERDGELTTALSDLRLVKDEAEIAELQSVVDSTHRGFEDVIRALPRSRTERFVEGVFHLRARVEGNDVGYNTIAAAGHHACTLHWNHNDGPLRPGELLLLDAGVEGTSLYTADITRTLPVSGRFTAEQRIIYDLVHEAQQAAMAMLRPGIDFMAPNREGMRILTLGLCELGILRVPAEEALDPERQLYRRYTLHNISHMLGLDVHDCPSAHPENYKFGQLQPGLVLTVEPGLYFQRDDLTVPERFRGIGVRIEDDVLITEDGYRNLSAAIPATADEVEAWMERVWSAAPPDWPVR